jgi:stage V sporulation protein B
MSKSLILEDKQSTTKGFAILSAAGLLVKILSLLYVPFLRGILGEEGIGIYGVTYNIFVFMYIITNSGIPVAISKMISELIALDNYKDAVKSFKMARSLLFLVGLLMFVLMFILAAPIAKFLNYPRAALAVKVLSPTLLITAVLSSYRGYFQGRGNMTPTAVSQVIEQVMNIIFSLGFAVYLKNSFGLEAGVAGATIGTSVGAFIAVLVLIIFYKRNDKFKVLSRNKNKKVKRYTNKSLFKKLLNYSVPMTICIGLQNLGLIIDPKIIKARLLTINLFDNRLADIRYGWLYQYNTLIFVPITIIMSLAVAVLPSISGLAAINDRRALEDKINYSFRLCFIISLPAAFGLMCLSTPIFKLLGYSIDAAILMKYGAVILIFMAVVQVQTSILQGIGKLYVVTLYVIFGLIAKIIVNYIAVAVPSINILGALMGNAVCFLIPLILNYLKINKVLKIKVSLFKHSIKPFIAASVMGVVAYLLHYNLEFLFSFIKTGYLSNAVSTIIAIVVAVFVYLYVMILEGGITRRDLKVLPSKLVRLIPKFMILDMDE